MVQLRLREQGALGTEQVADTLAVARRPQRECRLEVRRSSQADSRGSRRTLNEHRHRLHSSASR